MKNEITNGSEKQIIWANSLREKAFSAIYNIMIAIPSTKSHEEIYVFLEEMFNRLPCDSKWWIDNRTNWDNGQMAMTFVAPYLK